MKYKVGDKVKIKSLDWYNENKDNYGAVYAGNGCVFWNYMARHCGEIMEIAIVKVDPENSNKCYYFMENSGERWTDEMIEGLVEEKNITINRTNGLQFKELNISLENEMEWNLPQGYQFKDENGNVINATKIVLEKIKKEYPKTYKECCEVIKIGQQCMVIDLPQPYQQNMSNFFKLLICRDAYWKIYGKEMKLGKSWKPDWTNLDQLKYCIMVDVGEIITTSKIRGQQILVFPTAEMRDAFYINFKDLIEQCKELL